MLQHPSLPGFPAPWAGGPGPARWAGSRQALLVHTGPSDTNASRPDPNPNPHLPGEAKWFFTVPPAHTGALTRSGGHLLLLTAGGTCSWESVTLLATGMALRDCNLL